MSSNPKETGLIFTSDSVRAILDGRKTQTRRIIKPQPEKDPDGTKYNKSGYWCAIPGVGAMTPLHYLKHLCPYGKVGDRLWVRETFNDWKNPYYRTPKYKATDENYAGAKWKSSRFMPKKFARIWLEITGIREERVQDISDKDCVAEGIEHCTDLSKMESDHFRFIVLWDSINAKRGFGWNKNNWVRVIEFKVEK